MESLAQNSIIYVSDTQFAGALLAAAFLGAVLGLERSLAGKHAGMRTYALVSLGSALFTLLGVLASYDMSFMSGINPLQLAGSVIIGIGFIGSGLSVFRGEHPVELTTATGVWLAAGIGMACGFGYYLLAAAATLLGLIIFTFFFRIETALQRRFGYQGREKE
jgi:putative Mg2+ transporter-C (MgtC) family protein